MLVAIFSAFGFLFLVPFIIEPAYTTIKMDFDEEPAQCITASSVSKRGLTNCTWTSCREGCTREVYECTQILVNYKHPNIPDSIVLDKTNVVDQSSNEADNDENRKVADRLSSNAIVEYDDEDFFAFEQSKNVYSMYEEGGMKYKWFYGARLFPNVKGCGYPPYLNCTIFNNTYTNVGSNYSCYYSRADPSLVVTELDMDRVHFNLILALLGPIVSFIISVIYLTFAYFYIYNDPKVTTATSTTEKSTPSRRKVIRKDKNIVQVTPLALSTPLAPPTSGVLTPASDIFRDDMGSLGHQYKYSMVDDMLSRDSLDSLAFNYSSSMNG